MGKCSYEKCGNEFEAKRNTAKYCSAKCRKLAFSGGQDKVSVPVYLTDAVGCRHKIDYEGRRKDFDLLESWADGNGTEWQCLMGTLARHYRLTKLAGGIRNYVSAVCRYLNDDSYNRPFEPRSKPPEAISKGKLMGYYETNKGRALEKGITPQGAGGCVQYY